VTGQRTVEAVGNAVIVALLAVLGWRIGRYFWPAVEGEA
jgi:ABC-type phosphate transport system auxiliary subunit